MTHTLFYTLSPLLLKVYPRTEVSASPGDVSSAERWALSQAESESAFYQHPLVIWMHSSIKAEIFVSFVQYPQYLGQCLTHSRYLTIH